ncbi:hypothetical protein [Micromonospora sp. NPDC050200]|uniref:hypothetical protein n=1 Tax=Micromonospora sp. NPDC050200 TaxID=3155664 RepID=UPI0033DE6055
MAEQVGLDTEYLKSDAFKQFRAHLDQIQNRLDDMWTPGQMVPFVQCDMDEIALKLATTAIDAVNGLKDGLDQLVDSDGENVDILARLASLQEDNATDESQKFNNSLGGH